MYELNHDYKKLLKKIRRKIYFDLADYKKTDQVLDDLHEVFLDAQKEGKPADDFIHHDFHEFYNNLLSSMNDQKTQRNKRLKYAFLSVLIIGGCLFAGYQYVIHYVLSSNYQIKQNGLTYIMYDSHYLVKHENIHDIEFTLDLTKDLRTYQDFLVYQDDDCKLTISEITEKDNFYLLNFYSEGKYDTDEAMILLLDQRVVNEQAQIHYETIGQVQVLDNQYYPLTQNSKHLVKDGLYIGYELFPLEWYEKGKLIHDQIDLSDIHIRITDLRKTFFERL